MMLGLVFPSFRPTLETMLTLCMSDKSRFFTACRVLTQCNASAQEGTELATEQAETDCSKRKTKAVAGGLQNGSLPSNPDLDGL